MQIRRFFCIFKLLLSCQHCSKQLTMKEDYLHFLWRMRFLPTRSFTLADETEIEILEFGEYNENESGPDFFHAKIIVNGTLLFGHVEFHLKSSDWYRHKHQFDPAYDNVILHVVWEFDKDVHVQDRKLPTLELSKIITTDFSQNYRKSKENLVSLPCQYALEEVDKVYIEKEKETALLHRLSRKTNHFPQNSNLGFAQTLYELIAAAFGAKVNRDPFLQLTKEIPIVRLVKMSQRKRVNSLMSASGIYEESALPNTGMQKFQWKKKGLHPNGAPEIRVAQFAEFVAHFNFDFGFLDLPAQEFVGYVRSAFTLAQNEKLSYSEGFQNLIIINGFVPFLYWLGETRGEEKWQKLAFQILEELPKEQNQMIRFLQKAGFEIASAYDSQALLELYALRCSRKKCLTCSIGNQILKR